MKHSAIVRFLCKNEGGRISPPVPGYKPHVKIGNEQTSCCISPKDQSIRFMEFGDDYEVFIEFQYEELYADQIKSGLNIGLYEGSRLVGHGYMI